MKYIKVENIYQGESYIITKHIVKITRDKNRLTFTIIPGDKYESAVYKTDKEASEYLLQILNVIAKS